MRVQRLTLVEESRMMVRVREFQQNNRDRKPKYSDKRKPAAPAPRVRSFKTAEAPEGSENWVRPWVQLKYFTYNPAVFPRMLGAVSPDAEPGCLINVYDKNGDLFGGGFWNPQSRTPLRMLYHGPEILKERDLEESLRRAVSWRRQDCSLETVTNAYRVIHGDSDGLGGFIADRYNDVLSLEVSCLGVWVRLKKWIPLLHELCGTKRHVITTKVEHSAVLAYGHYLEDKGYEVTWLGVDDKGQIDLEELERSIRPDTALVSMMYANNETGTVFPIDKVAQIVKSHGVQLHVDAVQAVGKEVIDLRKLPIDYLAMSGHKLHAPKGVGVL